MKWRLAKLDELKVLVPKAKEMYYKSSNKEAITRLSQLGSIDIKAKQVELVTCAVMPSNYRCMRPDFDTSYRDLLVTTVRGMVQLRSE